MAMSAAMSFSLSSPNFLNRHRHNPLILSPRLSLTSAKSSPSLSSNANLRPHSRRNLPFSAFSFSGDGGDNNNNNSGGGGGGGDDGGEGDGEAEKNRKEAMMVLGEIGRSVDTLPKDLSKAIKEGKISAEIVRRFLNLEGLGFMKWLLQFGGFRERLLADDLFLAKLAMECGVGIFTKVSILDSDSILVIT